MDGRRRDAQRADELLLSRIRAALPGVARVLRGFGARRAWVFGSVARGRVHERSDLDLAVEGLGAGRHFEACARMAALVPVPLDVLVMETADAAFAARIRREGVELHVAG